MQEAVGRGAVDRPKVRALLREGATTEARHGLVAKYEGLGTKMPNEKK